MMRWITGVLFSSLSACALTACTAKPTIELLGFPECPNSAAMRSNLTAAIESMHMDWVVVDINQELLAQGDIRRGYPAPTILIDRADLFGLPAPTGANLGCRLYVGGVPSSSLIAQRLGAWKVARFDH